MSFLKELDEGPLACEVFCLRVLERLFRLHGVVN